MHLKWPSRQRFSFVRPVSEGTLTGHFRSFDSEGWIVDNRETWNS